MASQPADLSIRRARPEDVPELLRLVRELAEYEKLADKALAGEEDFERALFGEPPQVRAALAEIRGEPVGCALWFYNFSTFVGRRGLYLEDLFVRPPFRGRGIGIALLRWLAREALANGCGRMEWAVLDWNQSAIDFYRALGAESMDDWIIFRLSGDKIAELAGGGETD